MGKADSWGSGDETHALDMGKEPTLGGQATRRTHFTWEKSRHLGVRRRDVRTLHGKRAYSWGSGDEPSALYMGNSLHETLFGSFFLLLGQQFTNRSHQRAQELFYNYVALINK